jgi:hypothetical protein
VAERPVGRIRPHNTGKSLFCTVSAPSPKPGPLSTNDRHKSRLSTGLRTSSNGRMRIVCPLAEDLSNPQTQPHRAAKTPAPTVPTSGALGSPFKRAPQEHARVVTDAGSGNLLLFSNTDDTRAACFRFKSHSKKTR